MENFIIYLCNSIFNTIDRYNIKICFFFFSILFVKKLDLPARIEAKVLFPEPYCPRIAVIWYLYIFKEIPCKIDETLPVIFN